MTCKYAETTDMQSIIKCTKGYFGGFPHIGVCMVCDAYDGSPRGAGDVVSAIAQPIARAIDSVIGTNVAGCGGCKERRRKLNKAMPIKGRKP